MNSRDLDTRIQFLAPVAGDDGLRRKEGFAPVGGKIWSKKTDVNDGEKWRAGQVSASIMSRFLVRYGSFTSSLTPKHRLDCAGVEYEILGIKAGPGRRQTLEITAIAKADT